MNNRNRNLLSLFIIIDTFVFTVSFFAGAYYGISRIIYHIQNPELNCIQVIMYYYSNTHLLKWLAVFIISIFGFIFAAKKVK